ncbi:MAG: sensor histidine kinase [Candidatus Polarisedimenticolia bacterium]
MRILLLLAAAVLAPAAVSFVVWLLLSGSPDLGDPLRLAWIAAAGMVAWLFVAIVGNATGRALDDGEGPGLDEGAEAEPTEGEPLGEEGLLELIPSVDLAGLSRVADAISSETTRPPGPSLKRFLTFARPARPRRRRLRLNEAIQVVVTALREGPGGAEGARLSFDPDPNVDLVPVDPDALHRALVNLIRNAREAAGPQGSVEVRTQMLSDRVLVAVRDDGPGMPPEELQRIFQPFYTTRRGAMGLGLAICRQVAEAHGGSIRALNVLPRGLEVGLELPMSRLPMIPRAEEPAPGITAGQSPGTSPRA